MHIAQDTFTAQLPDGSFKHVTKGDWLHDDDELVRRDQDPKQGSGVLFRKADTGEPAPRGRRAAR